MMGGPGISRQKSAFAPYTPSQATIHEDEALYEGFNDMVSTNAILQTVASSSPDSAGVGVASPSGLRTAVPGTSMRPPTSLIGGGSEAARPMTSIKGAGYNSVQQARGSGFDPLKSGDAAGGGISDKALESSPQQIASDMERQVHKLLEESAAANAAGDTIRALDKAKDAGKKERALSKHREKSGLADQMNHDLTYAVCFNLANQYAASGMHTEALSTYTLVVKSKQSPQAGRLRVNMGNIYYHQQKYTAAIKMYRMAMDLIGQTSKQIRCKIQRNIGNAFVRLGQYQDAILSYEAIMDAAPDLQTGFNLVVCYYATGDRDKMKKGFMQLLSAQRRTLSGREAEGVEDDDDNGEDNDAHARAHTHAEPGSGSDSAYTPTMDIVAAAAAANDDLRKELTQRRKRTSRLVLLAAKLVAPVLEDSFAAGYDWLIEHLRAPRASSRNNDLSAVGSGDLAHTHADGDSSKQGFPEVAMEMEIAKGVAYLKHNAITEAIDVFKGIEKREAATGLNGQAATNLAFLYFLEGDYKSAEKYSEIAVRADRYNAKALVNKANVLYVHEHFEAARELYLEAIGVDADCVEAIFNLGLVNKRMEEYDDALQAFKKLHRIVPKETNVIYHIANLYEILGDNQSAAEWFRILHGAVPTDSRVLARLGALYSKLDDDNQALHNYTDAYNCDPSLMDVVSWLGIWYVQSEMYEKAIHFFERAAEIQPDEVKWRLMTASCHRRLGNLQAAMNLYKRIHKADPDNVECLRFICSLCKDLNDPDYEQYTKLLAKAERNATFKSQGDALEGVAAMAAAQHQQQQQQMQMQQQMQQYGVGSDNRDEENEFAGEGAARQMPRLPQEDAPDVGSHGPLLHEKFNEQIKPMARAEPLKKQDAAEKDVWGDNDVNELLP